jgi:hypothetical protein
VPVDVAVSDGMIIKKPAYRLTLRYISGQDFQIDYIDFLPELSVKSATWGAIKSLYE